MLDTIRELKAAEIKIKEAASIIARTPQRVFSLLTVIEEKAKQKDAFSEEELVDIRAAYDLVVGYCAEITDRAEGVGKLCQQLARRNAIERFFRLETDRKDSKGLDRDVEKFLAFGENVDTLVELVREFEIRFEHEAKHNP